ncbi:hypothetical protein ACWDOP_37835 [Nocardia sp. NPDC003693]
MSYATERRLILVGVGTGAVVLATAGFFDHLLFGVFICAGMMLGLANAHVARASIGWAGGGARSGARALVAASGLRLFGVTALAFVIGVLTRPDGLGIFFGLLAFQIATLLSYALPIREHAR